MTIAGFGRPLMLAGATLLAGCVADTTAYYTPPPGLTPDHAVSVLGSKDPKSLFQSSEYHLVWAVDGRVVKDSATRWDKPLLVTAGETHRLSIAYGWGGIAGTSFWVDPLEDFFAIMMMQGPGQRDYFRPLFRTLVYATFED